MLFLVRQKSLGGLVWIFPLRNQLESLVPFAHFFCSPLTPSSCPPSAGRTPDSTVRQKVIFRKKYLKNIFFFKVYVDIGDAAGDTATLNFNFNAATNTQRFHWSNNGSAVLFPQINHINTVTFFRIPDFGTSRRPSSSAETRTGKIGRELLVN